MNAQEVYDTIPAGTRVHFSDGTPEPPARHVNKHRAWKRSNGSGIVGDKRPDKLVGRFTLPASVEIVESDNGYISCIRLVEPEGCPWVFTVAADAPGVS